MSDKMKCTFWREGRADAGDESSTTCKIKSRSVMNVL
jgi:hypothetical protein